MKYPIDTVSKLVDITLRKMKTAFALEYNKSIMIEFQQNHTFLQSINQSIKKNDIFRTRDFESIYQFYVYRNAMYYLTRVVRPEIVVETGVLHGLTSAWILQALHENGNGRLISIDLPRRDWKSEFGDKEYGPLGNGELEELANESPGWIVPEYLRDNWELIIGSSERELPKLMERNICPDIFIHDSDHSYETMKFECEQITSKCSNPYIVIDNFDVNNYAFQLLSSSNSSSVFIDNVDPQENFAPSTVIIKQ